MLDFLKNDGIINHVHDFGELCNGSTTDSDSVCWGSNPYSAAKPQMAYLSHLWLFFYDFLDIFKNS